MVDRRTFLGQSAAAAALLLAAPHVAVAQAATDRRFVFIIQRGAADGLGTLAPTGDPAFAGLRGAFAEDFAGGARVGDFFTLHPALAEVGAAVSRRARPCSSTPSPRPIATARISTARTCSRPAAMPPMRCATAG